MSFQDRRNPDYLEERIAYLEDDNCNLRGKLKEMEELVKATTIPHKELMEAENEAAYLRMKLKDLSEAAQGMLDDVYKVYDDCDVEPVRVLVAELVRANEVIYVNTNNGEAAND